MQRREEFGHFDIYHGEVVESFLMRTLRRKKRVLFSMSTCLDIRDETNERILFPGISYTK